MTTPSNLRPLPIHLPNITSRSEAQQWLETQRDPIKRVTQINETGQIVQRPVVEQGCFVDPTARLLGGLILSRGCYVGPYAVVRLDEKPTPQPLIVGEDSNIQDGAIVHSTTQKIGARVIIAHQAIVHGAEIEDEVSIYIQAVADGNGTVIGRGSFLHQGSYVGKGIRIPDNRYVAPGQKVLTQEEASALPPVPQVLIDIRDHVLEHNRAHVQTHSDAMG